MNIYNLHEEEKNNDQTYMWKECKWQTQHEENRKIAQQKRNNIFL